MLSTFSQDVTEWHCDKHGKQSVAHVYAGVSFCPQCVRDKLIEIGVAPLHERVVTITTEE
jgi:hypothetical protein